MTRESCSTKASVNASESAWVASRAVMKNETTSTPSGGLSTNVDISADLPAHGAACQYT